MVLHLHCVYHKCDTNIVTISENTQEFYCFLEKRAFYNKLCLYGKGLFDNLHRARHHFHGYGTNGYLALFRHHGNMLCHGLPCNRREGALTPSLDLLIDCNTAPAT